MILKKCPNCKRYTIKEICQECKTKTDDAHYKFRERFSQNKQEKESN
jgi:rRNA maturation protein Nop10